MSTSLVYGINSILRSTDMVVIRENECFCAQNMFDQKTSSNSLNDGKTMSFKTLEIHILIKKLSKIKLIRRTFQKNYTRLYGIQNNNIMKHIFYFSISQR